MLYVTILVASRIFRWLLVFSENLRTTGVNGDGIRRPSAALSLSSCRITDSRLCIKVGIVSKPLKFFWWNLFTHFLCLSCIMCPYYFILPDLVILTGWNTSCNHRNYINNMNNVFFFTARYKVQAHKSFMCFQADRNALYVSPAVLHFVFNLLILGA